MEKNILFRMNFNKLLNEMILLEGNKDKVIALHKKWVRENPNLTVKDTTNIFNEFQNRIRAKIAFGFDTPEIFSFALRYRPGIEGPDSLGFFKNMKHREPFTFDVLKKLLNIRYTKEMKSLGKESFFKNYKEAVDGNKPTFFNKVIKIVKDENGKDVKKEVYGSLDASGNPIEFNTEHFTKQLEEKKNIDRILAPYIQYLNNIDNYTYEQIIFLYNQYDLDLVNRLADAEAMEDEELRANIAPSITNTAKSKSALQSEDSKNIIFSNNGIRIYKVPNQAACIRYGYYGNSFKRNLLDKYRNDGTIKDDTTWPHWGSCRSWCITDPSTTATYYGSYRNAPNVYTYYFIIDDSRNFTEMTPEEIQAKGEDWATTTNLRYYISVLCVNDRYNLSDLTNPGEPTYSWEKICEIYPGIEGAKDLLVRTQYSNNELIDKDNKRANVVEDIDNINSLSLQSQSTKKNYIVGQTFDNGQTYTRGTISAVYTWRSLSDYNKKQYIELTDERNYLDKFKSKELFKEIMGDDDHADKLRYWLYERLRIPNAFGNIKQGLLRKDYEDQPTRVCSKNEELRIIKKRNVRKYGLIDLETLEDYVGRDGTIYDLDYIKTEHHTFYMPDDEVHEYWIELYAEGHGVTNDKNFYCGTKYDSTTNKTLAEDVFFFSKKAFDNLVSSGVIEVAEDYEEGFGTINDFEALKRESDLY